VVCYNILVDHYVNPVISRTCCSVWREDAPLG
jgi:hypothetical protein